MSNVYNIETSCNDTNQQTNQLVDNIKKLQSVNKKIAKLLIEKEDLTSVIVKSFNHNHEGQKTYEYDMYKIEIKSPVIYSLDKKLYESGEINLPREFNPIKESVSYTIDKRSFEKYLDESPLDVHDDLASLIQKKPGKISVIIKERV